MKRVFAAIDIPLSARNSAARHIASLRMKFAGHKIGWVRPDNLHLTLKFFGDVADIQLEKIEEVIAVAADEFEPFKFEIAGTGVFPNRRRPRVLWLGIENPQTLQRVAAMLDLQCEQIGFPPEKRPFHPHLTIARIREPERSGIVADEHLCSEFESNECWARDIVLYQSVLGPDGSTYTRLRSFAFAKS
ncbi:MAG TPA: RNA 2',3'-cyclic phosphodiesterase [Pyrinomonadaceae bacterium]|nr:RNA 2',3'-cyclic phosphodiesterase [Pyrinomonadaceae bacterium]